MCNIRFLFLLILLPGVKLQLSSDTNLIWTVQMENPTAKLLKFVSGEPPTQNTGTVTVQTLSVNLSDTRPFSLTFDYQSSNLYFVNLADGTFYRMNLSNPVQPQITAVHRGFASAIQLAMDWSTGNLYWVDQYFSWIVIKPVAKPGITDFKVLLESDVEEPGGLALDPTRGYMFWTERRRTPIIRRAELDGTDRRVIAVGGIIRPTAMTIDLVTAKIYWVDYTKDTLESCFGDGRERRIIAKINGRNFAGVAYYKNTLFVTDADTKQVFAIREQTGSVRVPFRDNATGDPRSIIMYAAELQPSLSDPCSALNCEHFCVRTVSSARCLCQDGYTLSPDGYSCTGSTIYSPRLLVYANKTHVCFVDIISIFDTASPTCPVTNNTDVIAVVPDSHRRLVYYADRGRSKIFSISLRSGDMSTIVSSAGQVEGLAFDWLTNTIYWTDSSSNSVKSLSITSNTRNTDTVSVTGRLGRVTVDPFSRRLFLVTTNPASIVMKGYDSRDTARILVNSDINRPADIHCDPVKQRVLWADSGSIKTVNMDGTGQEELISTFDSSNRGLVSSKAVIFWTSKSAETTLNAGTDDDKDPSWRIVIQSSTELVDVDVLDASAQQTTRGVCFENGGCDHYCIPMPGGRECQCELGYELQADGRTCTTEFLQNEHLLVADLDGKRLYQVDMDSGQPFGSFLVHYSTTGIAVDPTSTILYWSDLGQRMVYSSYLNGSSIKTLFQTDLEYVEHLAVDPSTGNIFYSARSQNVGRSYIAVASPDGQYQENLITGLNIPGAIALHSTRGIMFWSDYGNDPHIGRANMDGSQRETIVSTNIKFPTGIAIDIEANLLYWADGLLDVIERCSFHGSSRQIIHEDSGAFLMGLVINKDKLYYTAWHRPGITVVNKADGSNRRLLAESPIYAELRDLIVVRPNIHRTANNACTKQNGGCSTICLPTETGKTCACGEGTDLQLDGLTCVGATPRIKESTTIAVTTGRIITTTVRTASSTEKQSGSAVIITSIAAGTVAVVAVLVVLVVVLIRKRKRNRQPHTAVYSAPQVPGLSARDGYNNVCYIRDSAPPPVPPDHPPTYNEILQDDSSAGMYLTPFSESEYSEPKK